MAIPQCLVNYIGLRGVCTELALGGLWIDDMPDSGIVKLEGLSSVEFEDFKKVWEKIYRRTTETWISDIRKLLDPKMKTNPVLLNAVTGTFDSTLPTTASAVYSGQTLSFSGSRFMEIFFESVQLLMSGADVTTTVKIWDIDTGEELHSQSVDAIAGMNTVLLNVTIPLNYGERNIFIGFNRTAWTGYKAANSSCGCDGVNIVGVAQSISTGSISPFDKTALMNDSQDMGIVVRFGLRCSLQEFVCQNRDALNISLRYKAYIELLAEILYNDTITNKITLISREEIRTRITEFTSMYQQELSLVLDSISYKDDRVCFDCNQPIMIKHIHP